MATRQEHMDWAKKRAIDCIDRGSVQEAFASMASDMGKHPDTQEHVGVQLGMVMLMTGNLDSPDAMRKFIEGFN